MNLIDVILILCILLFGVIGLKRGVIKELTITIGTVIVVVLAFYFKNPLANLFCSIFPFFEFGGAFQGLTVLNLVFYQLIAFILITAVLMLILNVLITASSIFEKFLKMTIILGIPSKILGAIVGLVEGVVVAFVIVFFISQPAFHIDGVQDASVAQFVLNSTPVLSPMTKDLNQAFQDIYELSTIPDKKDNKNEFNKETVDILLKYKVIDADLVTKLIDNGKLKIVGIDSVLNKYR